MRPSTEAILLLGPTASGKRPLGDELARLGLGDRLCAHFDFGAQLRRAAERWGARVPEAHRERLLSDFLPVIDLLADPDVVGQVGSVTSFSLRWAGRRQEYREDIPGIGPQGRKMTVDGERVACEVALSRGEPISCTWETAFQAEGLMFVNDENFIRAGIEPRDLIDKVLQQLPRPLIEKLASAGRHALIRCAAVARLTDAAALRRLIASEDDPRVLRAVRNRLAELDAK